MRGSRSASIFNMDVTPQYSRLGDAIRGTCQSWCDREGYSDPFCKDGEWWAFPPEGVMPVRIKSVIDKASCQDVQIGTMTLTLCPDGSIAT
ncbi:MAG: hypothetical protein AAF716_18140 [Cyanobacteria bacterium P01_D01_bin.1]